MSAPHFENATIVKKTNVYFDGKCVSHNIILADGTRKSIGVILPTDEPVVFKTAAAERMEMVSGKCKVRLAGESDFEAFEEGQSFFVPGDSSFELIAITNLDYVCHYEG